MKILLIDIGNTTCDFRAFDPLTKTFIKLFRPLSQDKIVKEPEALRIKLQEIQHQFSAIIYVSVVPPLNPFVKRLGELLNIPTYSARKHFPINTEYFQLKNLSQLGADFIANFYGYIRAYEPKNAAIVSLGSATTIFVVENSKFLGTTISPGLKFSLDALLSKAALLKDMNYCTSNLCLATNTFEAINIGTINGHYYMIKGLLAEIRKEYLLNEIIFTGGNSTFYVDLCRKDNIIVDEELIFKGLIHMYHSLSE